MVLRQSVPRICHRKTIARTVVSGKMGRRNEHESTTGILGSSSLLFYCILSSSLFFHAHLCCSCAFTHFKNVLEEVVVAQEPADVEMEAEMVEETQAAVVEVYLTQQAATDDSSSDDAFDSSSSDDDAFDNSSSDDAFDDSSSDNTFDDMANEVQEMQEELAQEEIREQEQEQEREQDAILEQDRIAEEIREQQREQDEEILREFREQEREEAD